MNILKYKSYKGPVENHCITEWNQCYRDTQLEVTAS